MQRVLIVDDMPDNLFLLEELLKEGGFEVSSAQNGAEALRSARSNPPDMVISDLLMPVMDGYTLCREWHADAELRRIPFIVYTATFTEKQDEALALSLGADRFVLKPHDADDLLDIIYEVLSAAEKRMADPVPASLMDENVVLKEYSEALFRKLEKKMIDLEQANRELTKSEEKFSGAFRISPSAFMITDLDTGRYMDINDAFTKILGYTREDVIGRTSLETGMWLNADDRKTFLDNVKRTGECAAMACQMRHKDGGVREITISGKILFCEDRQNLLAVLDDMTEKKKLQEQLVHSQKMETVGRLAGGVAHDFNNMLAIIFIGVELLKSNLDEHHPLLAFVNDIDYAAKRSRDITRQLLAFSRKQMIAPRPCDLNALIAEMQKSLARLIGEDIELRFVPGRELGKVMVDPSQVDQILVNLAVNARDAMPHGGKLTIETANITVDEGYGREHAGFIPGHYVRLVVSDNGVGMDKETLGNIFEPFFTTKEVGKGTGLGLATIYGIVKQNEGFIDVYSEVGLGTSFKIYLRRIEVAAADAVTPQEVTATPTGTESILVVEDDEVLCRATKRMLETLGYVVTAAMKPEEALAMVKQGNTHFDLLLADVVMPELNGAQLADQISSLLPGIKVLYMSGYTAEAIVHRGVLDNGVHFIQKPFSTSELAGRVRALLD